MEIMAKCGLKKMILLDAFELVPDIVCAAEISVVVEGFTEFSNNLNMPRVLFLSENSLGFLVCKTGAVHAVYGHAVRQAVRPVIIRICVYNCRYAGCRDDKNDDSG